MSARCFQIVFALSVLGLFSAPEALAEKKVQAKAGQSKTTKQQQSRKRSTNSRRIAHRLVPPPPAYMPSILPELYYQNNVAEGEEEEEEVPVTAASPAKPKNPYAKYFYSADHVVPKAVQARSGVTTWAQTR